MLEMDGRALHTSGEFLHFKPRHGMCRVPGCIYLPAIMKLLQDSWFEPFTKSIHASKLRRIPPSPRTAAA